MPVFQALVGLAVPVKSALVVCLGRPGLLSCMKQSGGTAQYAPCLDVLVLAHEFLSVSHLISLT